MKTDVLFSDLLMFDELTPHLSVCQSYHIIKDTKAHISAEHMCFPPYYVSWCLSFFPLLPSQKLSYRKEPPNFKMHLLHSSRFPYPVHLCFCVSHLFFSKNNGF